MPVNSSRFNSFFIVLLAQVAFAGTVLAQIPDLSEDQLRWLGERIYQNECNSRPACLTSWNAGEEFPSLGIGHFIWYSRGYKGPFEETFPGLVDYLQTNGVAVPAWLSESVASGAPWLSREAFLEDIDSPKMRQLRLFLSDTQGLQVEFIARRLRDSLPDMLATLPAGEAASLEHRFFALATAHPPYGLYALIDYVHFKGTGVHASERYQGQGWGLLQVLQNMPGGNADIDAFVASATAVLQRRVANAPPERNEQRWLQGWINRLQSYLPPAP